MEQGIFFEPGEGMALSARGSSMLFKAVAGSTGGAFSLMERELPVSNRRPPSHRHQGPEGFYVLEGLIEFVVGDERRSGGRDFGLSFQEGWRTPLEMLGFLPRGYSSSMRPPLRPILWNYKRCGVSQSRQLQKRSVL